MDVQLTKDSNKLLCILYKTYLQRIKDGTDKYYAKSFGSSHKINNMMIPEWSIYKIDETCRELDRSGFLECGYYDGHVFRSTLNDDAIIYMEQRFKNGVKEFLEYFSKIIK